MSTATASLPFSTPHPTLTDLLSTDDPFHSGMADMQSPGAGPSRSGRPVRASRPTSFKSYLSHMDEDEEQERGSDSGMDTDGDGDEYQAPAEEDGNDDDDHEADEDAEGELDDAYLSDTYPLPTSQQSRSFTRNGSATPKRRPAAARNMVIFQGSVDPSELRTVGINGVPPPPDTTRSRSASRSLPPSRTEKKFKCTWEGCGKAYTKPARLREHELSHTGERPHVCPYCSQSYIRPTHLTAHLRTHMSEDAKRYVCSVEGCGKRFWTGTHARRHEDLHWEPKMYPCTQCDEKFSKANHLRDHVALEHMPPGTKGYPCMHEGCGMSFTIAGQLKAHEKTHDPSRYTCAHPTHETPCNFPNWSALQAHLQSAHPPTCPAPECGKVFKHAYRLKEHMRVHRPGGRGVPAEQSNGEGQIGEAGDAGLAVGLAPAASAKQRSKRKKPTEGEDAEEGGGEEGGGKTRGPAPKKAKGRHSKATRMANAAAAVAAAAAREAAQGMAGGDGHAGGMLLPFSATAADPAGGAEAYDSMMARIAAPLGYAQMHGQIQGQNQGQGQRQGEMMIDPTLINYPSTHFSDSNMGMDMGTGMDTGTGMLIGMGGVDMPHMGDLAGLDTYTYPYPEPQTDLPFPLSLPLPYPTQTELAPTPDTQKAYGCPLHLLDHPLRPDSDSDNPTGSIGLNAPRQTTCFARFGRAFDVQRHLRADHGVEMDLEGVKDLLGVGVGVGVEGVGGNEEGDGSV